MQPLYQIPGQMLLEHLERLRVCRHAATLPSHLHALLFLSGLRVAFHYYKAAREGNEFLTNWAPAHHLDDGLREAARACLKNILNRMRSRETVEMLAPLYPGSFVPKWAALRFCFAGAFDDCPSHVRTWLMCGDIEANQARLACAMGIEALWFAGSTAVMTAMIRERPGLDVDEHAAIERFTLTAANALPEL